MIRTRLPIHLSAVVAALLLLFPAVASADVVQMPPDDCPEGSIGRSGHVGPHCQPAICSSDADCPGAEECRQAALCQQQQHGASRGGPITVWTVTGPCRQDGSCADGGTCKPQSYCLPRAQPAQVTPAPTEATPEPEAEEPSKPGCSTAGSAGWSGLGLLVMAAIGLRRRR